MQPIEAGLADGLPYLALPYVHGESLDSLLRQPPASLSLQPVDVCRAVADAIDTAWSRGLGHGALHPRDIFVQTESGACQVTGFGVVQALADAGVRGPLRPVYAAPERSAGTAWDAGADIYALGLIARELFLSWRPELLPLVESVVSQASAEQPGERFGSASEFVRALESSLASQAADVTVERSRPADLPAALPPDWTLDEQQSETTGQDLLLAQPRQSPVLDPSPPVIVSDQFLSARPSAEPRYPWAAIFAVAIAGLAVGGMGGYQLGLFHGGRSGDGSQRAQSVPDLAGALPPVQPPDGVQPDESSLPNAISPAPARERVESRSAVAEPPRVGALDVDSRPRGARVTIDGRFVGQTPTRVEKLSPGEHRVLIEMSGHRRVSSTVKVTSGERGRFAVSLEQLTLARGGR